MSKSREQPSSRYSIAGLRAELAQALREAEAGEAVEITRRGEPVAVLLGREDYERLRLGGGDLWERLTRFRDEVDPAALDLDPDQIFSGLRDRSPGRKVDG